MSSNQVCIHPLSALAVALRWPNVSRDCGYDFASVTGLESGIEILNKLALPKFAFATVWYHSNRNETNNGLHLTLCSCL